MIHVASISSGLSSSVMGVRVTERYGAANTRFVFMDTKFEDDDNYRFLREWEALIGKRYGASLTTLTKGRTPYQVFTDEHIIPNDQIAPCTFRLKTALFLKWVKQLQEKTGEEITIHIGFDYSEQHRCAATTENYNAQGWHVDFPLLWKPIEWRNYAQVAREDWGIEPPRAYALGYTHANCGGRCVKQGQGDWLRTLIYFPERFAEIEEWERKMRENEVNANYALLTRTENKVVYPMPLSELRERYEAKQIGKESLFEMDYHSACVRCGVGDFVPGELILQGATK